MGLIEVFAVVVSVGFGYLFFRLFFNFNEWNNRILFNYDRVVFVLSFNLNYIFHKILYI